MIQRGFGFLLLVILFSSCSKEIADCFKNRGSFTQDKRALSGFTQIVVNDKIDLILIKDSLNDEFAMVEGWRNLLPEISLTVSNGVLNISDNNTCNFVRDLNNRTTVKVHFKQLLQLDVHDDATASSGQRLYLDSLVITNHGVNDLQLDMVLKGTLTTFQKSANNIILRGHAPVFVTVTNDVSSMDASAFTGDYTYVFQDSPRDCFVNPVKVLGGTISYSGNVYYYTIPKQISIIRKSSGNYFKK